MAKTIRRQFSLPENTDERACQLAKENGYITQRTEKAKPVDFIMSVFRWVLTIDASKDMDHIREIKGGSIGVVEALKEAWRMYCENVIRSHPPKR